MKICILDFINEMEFKLPCKRNSEFLWYLNILMKKGVAFHWYNLSGKLTHKFDMKQFLIEKIKVEEIILHLKKKSPHA